jgi:hypothetical protein
VRVRAATAAGGRTIGNSGEVAGRCRRACVASPLLGANLGAFNQVSAVIAVIVPLLRPGSTRCG